MRRLEEWYARASEQKDLESLSVPTVGRNAQAHPFGWSDMGSIVKGVPEDHWASGFVRGVARNLELNAGLGGAEKERILGEVLQTLGNLSRTDDERFADAE